MTTFLGPVRIAATGTAGTVEKLRINTPGTVDNTAAIIVGASAAACKPLVVQGASSQTANLVEWQDSTGAVLGSVASGGALTATIVNTPAGSISATTVQGAINELDTEKAALAGAVYTGQVAIGASTPTAMIAITGAHPDTSATTYGLLVQPTANSTATVIHTAARVRARTPATAYTVAELNGLVVGTPVIGAGSTATSVYGLKLEPQTGGGTTSYGAAIGASTTQTLWVSYNADNTTAAAGIAFGSSRDTTLHRSAANELTSGKLVLGAGLTATTGTFTGLVDVNSASGLKVRSGASDGFEFEQYNTNSWQLRALTPGSTLKIADADLQVGDAKNIVFDTSTGTKIGTATSQKIAFYNVTPIVQPANTVAIDDVLVNTGLRASGGVANFSSPITTAATGYVKTGAAVTGSRPSASTAGAGAMFYDTTLAKPIWSDGAVWAEAPAGGTIGNGAFGDGSDGTVTISVNTNLARDMYYDNLTVNSAIILKTVGYRIFVKGALTNNGTIHNNGNPPAVHVGGLAGPYVTLSGGSDGGNGNVAAGSNGGGNSPCVVACNGGNGGSGPSGAGGTGGVCTVLTAAKGSIRSSPWLILGHTLALGTIVTVATGGGGGGGGGDGTNRGGGGGGAGSYVAIAASIIVNAGTISANGGAGGNGSAGNSGGGGGGGGGVVALLYRTLTNTGTISANGGAGGTKVGTGVNGSTGSAGVVISLAT